MRLKIHSGDIHLINIRTRMPFKYGIATMTHVPYALLRVWVEVDGTLQWGVAADILPPKWFTKDPTTSPSEEVDEMLRVIEHARDTAVGLRGESPFDLWRRLYEAQEAWGGTEHIPPLLSNFGTSLIERAMIEAFCRAMGRPFAHLLHTDRLGIRLGEIHGELSGYVPSDLLPERPRTTMIARHTVGMADPLVETDILPDDRLEDGLPQSLTACIDAYGLRHFKIKLGGDAEHDVERLQRVAEVIQACAPIDYAFSLDGNEQFTSLSHFRSFWEAVCAHPALRTFLEHLFFVEQPFHRDVALEPSAMEGLRDWLDRPPIIIDESDGALDSLPRALRLGYAGTSYKNCKGVFKGISNACLLAHLRREQPSRTIVLSGEDLANIGPVALFQDLAVSACLGIDSIERNGHHYFAGLSMFPSEIQKQVIEAHGDLYCRQGDKGTGGQGDRGTVRSEGLDVQGWPRLDIREGVLHLGSVLDAPFGVGLEVDVEVFDSVDVWREGRGGEGGTDDSDGVLSGTAPILQRAGGGSPDPGVRPTRTR